MILLGEVVESDAVIHTQIVDQKFRTDLANYFHSEIASTFDQPFNVVHRDMNGAGIAKFQQKFQSFAIQVFDHEPCLCRR